MTWVNHADIFDLWKELLLTAIVPSRLLPIPLDIIARVLLASPTTSDLQGLLMEQAVSIGMCGGLFCRARVDGQGLSRILSRAEVPPLPFLPWNSFFLLPPPWH